MQRINWSRMAREAVLQFVRDIELIPYPYRTLMLKERLETAEGILKHQIIFVTELRQYMQEEELKRAMELKKISSARHSLRHALAPLSQRGGSYPCRLVSQQWALARNADRPF